MNRGAPLEVLLQALVANWLDRNKHPANRALEPLAKQVLGEWLASRPEMAEFRTEEAEAYLLGRAGVLEAIVAELPGRVQRLVRARIADALRGMKAVEIDDDTTGAARGLWVIVSRMTPKQLAQYQGRQLARKTGTEKRLHAGPAQPIARAGAHGGTR